MRIDTSINICLFLACSLACAAPVHAQTYEGAAQFSDQDVTQTFFPFDPDTGQQIEVTCTWRQSLSWSEMVVITSPPSIEFTVDAESQAISGTDSRFCVDGSNSYPFSLSTVVVSGTGVYGQNSTGSVTADLSFGSDGATLEGPVAQSGQTGQASLSLVGPESQLSELISIVVELNLQAGISSGLDSKLQNALDALDRAKQGDIASATGILYAFIQSVEAQRGKKLTDEQADELVTSAQTVIDSLNQL